MAAIHVASEDFGSKHGGLRLDLEYLIDSPPAESRPFLTHRSEDWRDLVRFAGRLRARAEAAFSARPDSGVCHGDFSSTGNFRVAEGHTPTVFDFDWSDPGWRV